MLRIAAIAAACAVAAALGLGAYLFLVAPDDRFAQCRNTVVAGGAAAIGGPFSLIRQDGVRVTEKDVIDRPTLVYFGFTYCPDVCPMDMGRNAEALDLLGERGIDARLAMISVDPERDTPQVMADYMSWLHPDAIGLTGSPDDVDAAKSAYRVYAAKSGEGQDYLVDHSTMTYLMAPGEGMLDFFRRDVTAEEVADKVACYAAAL